MTKYIRSCNVWNRILPRNFNRKYGVMKEIERFANIPKYQSYPHTFPITMSIMEYRKQFGHLKPKARVMDTPISLAGRIVSIRISSKNLVFLDVQNNNDTLQVLSELKHFKGCTESNEVEDIKNEFQAIHHALRRGDIIGVHGFPGVSGKGELSLISRQVHILAPCLAPLPNSKYGIKEPEIRFRQKYLDLLTNNHIRGIYETRALIIRNLRTYLETRGFLEVETPMLCTTAGGAMAHPFITNSRALSNSELYLRIAPELYLKQLIIGGFERVFEIGKVFRNEGIDATHNPEFTICEFYQTYADYESLMETAEELIRELVYNVKKSYQVEIDSIQSNEDDSSLEQSGSKQDVVVIDFSQPFQRLPIIESLEKYMEEKLPDLEASDAIEKLLDICSRHGIACSQPHTVARLVDKLIGHFLEPLCVQPTFLFNHPKCMSPLAKDHRSQPGVTERFELFVAGKELCNAYTELNDPTEQRKRFALQKEDKEIRGDEESGGYDEAFCEALEYGFPPTGGFGLGIDRLVMLLTNQQHIREVILFPAMKRIEVDSTVSSSDDLNEIN